MLVHDFAIPDDRKMFVIIESECLGDTLHDAIDVHRMDVSSALVPKGVDVSRNPNHPGALLDPSSIFVPDSHVQSISVLEYSESGDAEHVTYDNCLCFDLGSGESWALSVRDWMVGGLDLSIDPARVSQLKSRYRERVVLR